MSVSFQHFITLSHFEQVGSLDAAKAPPSAPASVVQAGDARAQRRRRRSETAHPRGGANSKRARVVRDAGADAVALWDVACALEDVCRLVDAMDKYIDSDGSQEYECGA